MSLSTKARAQSLDTAGRFSVGARLGFILPALVVPELDVRVIPHFTVGAFGLYLPPRNATTGRRGNETTIAGLMRYEGAGREGHGPFLQVCSQYLRLGSRAPDDWAEKYLFSTLTVGYQFRWKHFETQLGLGMFVVTQLNKQPPSPGIGTIDFGPIVLPTAELALRYRF